MKAGSMRASSLGRGPLARPSMALWLALAASLALSVGCGDDSASGDGGAADATVDAAPSFEPDGATADGAAPDGAAPDAASPDADVPDGAAPAAAWLEVELEPRRSLYGLDDRPAVRAYAFDRAGWPLPEVKVGWSVEPRGLAEVDPAGVLRFTGEGQGFVVGCIAGGVCGQAAFYVDAGPPTLVVEEPARGAVLGGENSATIRVRGSADDGGGRVRVRVNGIAVDLDAEGRFALDLEARFGVNRVEVSADDGVRRPAVVEVREVLWAPAWLRVDETGATIPDALELRLDQGLLDRDAPVDLPSEAGPVALDELAQVVGALLRLADPSALLGDFGLGDGQGLALSASGVRLGSPDVDLYFVGDGIELFLRLPDVQIDTQGHVDFEGERIGLGGTLEASLAAFVRLRFGLDGALRAEVDDVGVAVEGLVGTFADETAEALIATFGSRLREAAEALTGQAVGDLLADALPPLVEEGLASLLSTLGDVPIELDPDIEGFTPVTLRLALAPSTFEVRRRESLRLVLDARIGQEGAVASPHPDPGVPVLSEAALVRGPGAGLTGGVRLALVNGILHEVWRAGLLRLAPPLPAELAASLGQVTIDGVLPPVVAPAPGGGEFPLELQIGELRLETRPLGAEAGDLYVLSIRAGLRVRVAGGRFELAVSEDPDVRAELVVQSRARPVLPPDTLARLLTAVVWPQLQEALAGGLSLGFDPVEVDPSSFQEVAPRLTGLSLAPRFVQDPALEGGHVVLEGGIDVRLDLAAP